MSSFCAFFGMASISKIDTVCILQHPDADCQPSQSETGMGTHWYPHCSNVSQLQHQIPRSKKSHARSSGNAFLPMMQRSLPYHYSSFSNQKGRGLVSAKGDWGAAPSPNSLRSGSCHMASEVLPGTWPQLKWHDGLSTKLGYAHTRSHLCTRVSLCCCSAPSTVLFATSVIEWGSFNAMQLMELNPGDRSLSLHRNVSFLLTNFNSPLQAWHKHP